MYSMHWFNNGFGGFFGLGLIILIIVIIFFLYKKKLLQIERFNRYE